MHSAIFHFVGVKVVVVVFQINRLYSFISILVITQYRHAINGKRRKMRNRKSGTQVSSCIFLGYFFFNE